MNKSKSKTKNTKTSNKEKDKKKKQQLEEKNKKKEKDSQRLEEYLNESGLALAFNIIFAELISKQILPENFFTYTAMRLTQIGKEIDGLKTKETIYVDVDQAGEEKVEEQNNENQPQEEAVETKPPEEENKELSFMTSPEKPQNKESQSTKSKKK